MTRAGGPGIVLSTRESALLSCQVAGRRRRSSQMLGYSRAAVGSAKGWEGREAEQHGKRDVISHQSATGVLGMRARGCFYFLFGFDSGLSITITTPFKEAWGVGCVRTVAWEWAVNKAGAELSPGPRVWVKLPLESDTSHWGCHFAACLLNTTLTLEDWMSKNAVVALGLHVFKCDHTRSWWPHCLCIQAWFLYHFLQESLTLS